jgi:hypothetical protein
MEYGDAGPMQPLRSTWRTSDIKRRAEGERRARPLGPSRQTRRSPLSDGATLHVRSERELTQIMAKPPLLRRTAGHATTARATANGMQRPILRHRDCNSTRFRHVIEIGRPEGCPEGMGGRGILGLSPAQRDGAALFVQSGSSQRSRQGGGRSQAPADLPPLQREAKSPTSPKGEPSRKIPASVSPGWRFGDYQARQARAVGPALATPNSASARTPPAR